MSFIEFARSYGIDISEVSEFGKKIRAPIIGSTSRNPDGVYCLHNDSQGCVGWVKNFKTGEFALYHEHDYDKHYAEIVKNNYCEPHQKQDKHDKAVSLLKRIIKQSKKATDLHEYLKRKNISAYATYVDKYGNLIVPLQDVHKRLRSYIRIMPDGRKYYMKNSSKQGCFYKFGRRSQHIVIICEGFSTGASIYSATKITTLAAGDADNISHVAEAVRATHKLTLHIIIAGDDDIKLRRNVGRESAEKAAKLVGGFAIFPEFTDDELAKGYTDFNDYANSRGASALKELINKSIDAQLKSKKVAKRRIK